MDCPLHVTGQDGEEEVCRGRRRQGGPQGLRQAGGAERGVRGDGAGGARGVPDVRRAQVGPTPKEGHGVAQGVRLRRVPGEDALNISYVVVKSVKKVPILCSSMIMIAE